MGNILKNYDAFAENSLILDDNDAIERNQKEQEYLDYIKDHISKVIYCFNLYMIPLLEKTNISTLVSDEALKDTINLVQSRIDTHDASKFSDSEFDDYREKYYPTTKESEVINDDIEYKVELDERYQLAWKHHYETNVHHPEHWLNHEDNTCTDMSLDAIIEMLCDWEAMSLKFETSVLEWYENDAEDEKKCLSSKTKNIVEDLLYNVLHN